MDSPPAIDSLERLCQNYVADHFEEFPVSYLSLLPLSIRRDLLWRLPIADVCLRLENSKFLEGLDMTAYWELPCERFGIAPEFPKDSDIERYVKERWPSEAEYAKARLYGRVATCLIGFVPDDHEFVLPHGNVCDDDETILFLYGVRELSHVDECDSLTFPPRYHQMASLPSDKLDEDVFDAIIQCFKGEHPKMLPEIQLLKDSDIYCSTRLSDAELCFLSEVEYVGIQCRPFEPRGIDFIIKLVNKATHLQVLILQGLNLPDDPIYLDDFCVQVAACQPFWSKFRLLKIVPCFDELDAKEYVVSQDSLDQLIAAYFSAPTDHSQLVQFTYTKIKCQDTDNIPIIDQTHLQFKNIRLSNCRFVSKYKATPEAISKWLGQDVNILEKEEEPSSFLFQVDHKDSACSRKRKYSEL